MGLDMIQLNRNLRMSQRKSWLPYWSINTLKAFNVIHFDDLPFVSTSFGIADKAFNDFTTPI